MSDDRSDSTRPPFDLARAASTVGKYVVIGLTYYDHEGNFSEQKQLHGRISSVDERQGFTIELEGQHKGETYSLPPDFRTFQDAPPGEYRLRSTGEVIMNPDFVCMWAVDQPPPD